jgi:hypothetical protein
MACRLWGGQEKLSIQKGKVIGRKFTFYPKILERLRATTVHTSCLHEESDAQIKGELRRYGKMINAPHKEIHILISETSEYYRL